MDKEDISTDFGYERVAKSEKVIRVKEVFERVALKYDLMNDFMSFGIHRFWKNYCVNLARIRPHMTILDLAGGTGDLSFRIVEQLKKTGIVYLADINNAMLRMGQRTIYDKGFWPYIRPIQVNAENLCFQSNQFDRIFIGFGLRNVTDKSKALTEMYRVLKPGGQLFVLEFSTPTSKNLKKIYDYYSFKVIPALGKQIANDEASYRYLAESIRMHPNQNELKQMMIKSGFDQCDYFNLSGGITAIHQGVKF